MYFITEIYNFNLISCWFMFHMNGWLEHDTYFSSSSFFILNLELDVGPYKHTSRTCVILFLFVYEMSNVVVVECMEENCVWK